MSGRTKYLFIRILSACNADCFMCEFARSRDTYRFQPESLERIMPEARRIGVGVIRFTGGEPLLHAGLRELVQIAAGYGAAPSVITNGHQLPAQVESLASAGLKQVIVSIDAATAETHDSLRGTRGLFDRALDGLRKSLECGLVTRVNTVVGPHNFADMPELQAKLAELGVHQWELSAIKLERQVVYPDPADVVRICETLYVSEQKLRPVGHRFYGETDLARRAFFEQGILPRPAGQECRVVDDVVYLDGRSGAQYPCSCLPHRGSLATRGVDADGVDSVQLVRDSQYVSMRDEFRVVGPRVCSGCSTTAAGYSDDLDKLGLVGEWAY